MTVRPLHSAEKAATIADEIRNGIGQGRWAPGQRLIEADLSEQFGAGRGPVREALRMLAGDGVVELVPNRGARICGPVSLVESAQILQVIAALQFLAGDLLAHRGVGEDVASDLYRLADDVDDAIRFGRKADIMRAALAYQMRCNALCGNPYVGFAMQRINVGTLSGILTAAADQEALINAANHYRDLTDALVAGRRGTVRRILQRSYVGLLKAFSQPGVG